MGSASTEILHCFVRVLIDTAQLSRSRVANGPPGKSPAALVRRWLVPVCILAAVACGSPKSSAARPAEVEHDLLTRDEIQSSNARVGDLFDAIRSLRPRFLMTAPSVHSTGSTASMPLVVYFGRLRQAGVEALRTINASSVEEVRYLDPTAAQNEFGPMASGGALIVVLRDASKLPDTTVSAQSAARVVRR